MYMVYGVELRVFFFFVRYGGIFIGGKLSVFFIIGEAFVGFLSDFG